MDVKGNINVDSPVNYLSVTFPNKSMAIWFYKPLIFHAIFGRP
jgi:hypothetical protein